MNGKFQIVFHNSAVVREYKKLNHSAKILVNTALRKLEERADTLGSPLSGNLAGCRKLKFRNQNLRIVYRISEDGHCEIVEIIAIGKRENNEVYSDAAKRLD